MERWRDAEVVEGAVFGMEAIRVKVILFFVFWLSSSD